MPARAKISRPFLPIACTIGVIVFGCVAAVYRLLLYARLGDPATDPLFAAAATTMTILVAAVGWGVASWVSYRNARVQHTNTLIFHRFSGPAFSQHISNFVQHFGPDKSRVVQVGEIEELIVAQVARERDAGRAALYLINYFEFMAVGTLRGDIDPDIVKKNFTATICFYFDRCEPYISAKNRANPRVFENLIWLRAHLAQKEHEKTR